MRLSRPLWTIGAARGLEAVAVAGAGYRHVSSGCIGIRWTAAARLLTLGRVNEYIKAFAVMRIDDFASTEDPRALVTIVAVVPTRTEAETEVVRLSEVNADKNCRYFWNSTRYYPNGRGAGSTPTPDGES